MKVINPEGWSKPSGYSNGIVAEGKVLSIAGQIGWGTDQKIVSDNFVEQTAQALRNIQAVLSEAGAKPEDVVRLTWYVTDKNEYLVSAKEIGGVYREIFGGHFPAMSLVQVVALLEDQAKVEIEATAVIP